MDLTEISQRIAAAGFRLEHVRETGSTNAELMAAGAQGAPGGLVLVADVQRAGKGRRDRTWEAPPESSLLCSVLLRPPFAPTRAHLLAAAAGLSLRQAISELGVDSELKWPNDLMSGDRKLAGVLSEMSTTDSSWFAVVGTGCNLLWNAVGNAVVAPEVQAKVASLDEFVADPDRWNLLGAYLEGLSRRLSDIDSVADEYGAACTTVGKRVVISTIDGAVEATAVGIAADGGLLINVDGACRVIYEGDVVHAHRDRRKLTR